MTDFKLNFIMPRRQRICWTFGSLMLVGCSNGVLQDDAQLEVQPPVSVPLSVAKPKPPRAPAPAAETVKTYGLNDANAMQHLLNADTYIQAGNMPAALKELDLINQAEIPPEQRSKFSLLDAQIALSLGDAEQALHKLENVRPRLLAGDDKISFYQALAFAQALTGNSLPSVTARIRLTSLLQKPDQQRENIAAILDLLSVMPLETLNVPADMNDELAGWLSLAKILKQRDLPGVDLNAQIQQWRSTNPAHPANAEFLQAYLTAPQPPIANETAATPAAPSGPMIAVLLPQSGAFASAANAIKAGLQAAHKVAAASAVQLPLKFYDTEQGDIASLYKQAVAEGAKQVIGPLVKEQIQALVSGSELTVPVLALNHVENLSKANLVQFGLSPIDEAEQLALKAHHDGRQSAILLVPNNSQGHRIGQYLTSAWQSQGGSVLGMQSYDPKQHDIGTMLNGLLAAPTSANAPKPQQTLLLSASPEVARELAPQLKYHQNADLAVYAMPNIFSGRPNPAQDAELGKIKFCDMPWLFGEAYSGPLNQAALQSTWQNFNDTQLKLLALGLDAYNVLNQLPQLASTAYNGATGHLSLNSDNRITRKLLCAEYKAGVPVVTGFVE